MNQKLELRTTAMASHGHAVGRAPDGKVVFVGGALPGELVRVELTGDKSRYATARTTEVLDASPDRVAPPCPHVASGCGGCQWQHVTLPAQRRLKRQIVEESLHRLGHLRPPQLEPTVELAPWAYRTSLRAGVRDGRAALRRLRSADLVPAAGCLIAHPLLSDLLEGRRYGRAREVILRCGANTGDRLVATIPARLAVQVPAGVRPDHLEELAAGQRWRISAKSFFQSRPDGVDALAQLVSAAAHELAFELGKPGRAADLYSGVGVFAGVLAHAGWSVVAVEGSASAFDDSRVNLRGLEVEATRGDVGRWTPEPVDMVVADPSRDGLGRDAVAVIAGTGARRVVLISCDVASLARDAALLGEIGYRVRSITPVDLFPQTFHLEVVSVYDRANGRP
ncbi:MAG: class I SAM-dependent RNA methyltransferase [Acidimicrobiales bacterium]|nr:class I SAM-dependent RNA methyltransferase [Acidimicrobiales bacterium]